jgi:hypothetical protein
MSNYKGADMNIYEKLTCVQVKLKTPKDKTNDFGHYKYRNLESIMEQLKPLLLEYKLNLTLQDFVENIGNRYYVRSVAILRDIEKPDDIIQTQSFAREAESKKGMDESQVTGACHSYAGKYCLGSLFLCDDTADADSMNNKEPEPPKKLEPVKTPVTEKQKKTLRNKMVENGLSESEQVIFYKWVNPINDKEGTDFISKFDNMLANWQASQKSERGN